MTARPVVTSGLDYDPVLACRHLAEADPPLGALIARVGPCRLLPPPTHSLFAAVATGGAFFYALAMIWLRRIGPAESHEAVVLHFSLVALATMLLLALPSWTWPDARSGLYLLGAGLGGGGAQLAMTRAYSLHRAAPVTALSTLGVVFTWLLALPLFPERPTAWQLAGTLLVLAATALIGTATARPRYL